MSSTFRLFVSPGNVREVALENLALRQQLAVMKRQCPRPRLGRADRLFWVWLSRVWPNWRNALLVVRPETVVGWHRQGFRLFWTWVSRRKRCGRPGVSPEVRDLIRKMAEANPFWGGPRIHGELGKLGIEVSERTVSRLMPRRRKPPSQTWRAFLGNHMQDLVSVDFFTVPTATFRVLFVLVLLAHHRRRVVRFNVTEHPTAAWTAQQMVEAFPEDVAPRYLLHDRDKVYGEEFRHRIRGMHINEVLIAPQSPWQSPFVERLVGSIRRECLDHVIVLGERHLRRILRSYIHYYLQSRTHLSLAKDAPASRSIEPPEMGKVVQVLEKAKNAREHFRNLEDGDKRLPDTVRVTDPDPQLAPLLARVVEDTLFKASFSSHPIEIKRVELDNLVACQRHVDLDHVEHLREQLAGGITPEEHTRFCLLPRTLPPVPKQQQLAANAYGFSSPNPDFRFLGGFARLVAQEDAEVCWAGGPPVAAVVLLVGYGAPAMNAYKVGRRFVLNNGFHRAYALRAAGIPDAYLVVQHVSDPQLEFPQNLVGLPREYFLNNPRPAVLKDFFNPALIEEFRTTVGIRSIQVAWNANQSLVPV